MPEAGEPGAGQGLRLRVRSLEDGYPCWLEAAFLLEQGRPAPPPGLPHPSEAEIQGRIPRLLQLADQARQLPNVYLWGGTLGPDFDCSGLIQTLFAAVGVWLPRDAYLQERFCQPVAVRPGITQL
ncbi:MAG: C40 family peptidase, partial [Synechococcaceae cyanobacterium]